MLIFFCQASQPLQWSTYCVHIVLCSPNSLDGKSYTHSSVFIHRQLSSPTTITTKAQEFKNIIVMTLALLLLSIQEGHPPSSLQVQYNW